ncbi:hypothetical protein BDFG_03418 [Blastomyces dermatitidis ATCC 26199]|nr:hypothetical protein BDFG_03418 [Blastomyces dermatitidis ATCC 26199]
MARIASVARGLRRIELIPARSWVFQQSDEVRAMFRTQDWTIQVEIFHYEFIAFEQMS